MPNAVTYDEKAIQLSISEGDEKAFTLLFNHYYPLLHPLVAGYALTAMDIEEVLQETFIRIWMYRDRLPDIECLKSWIFRVASRECLSMLRKNLQEKKYLSTLQKSEGILMAEEDPADILYLSEISHLVQEAVNQMPRRRKLIFQMSRIDGMKPSEIAETLSLSVSTVKNVLSASLKYIREYLASFGIFLTLIFLFLWIF